MQYKDLREYIRILERNNLIRTVNGAHWDLEIGAITELEARTKDAKALLFDNITGYSPGFRILTNSLNSVRKTAIALGLTLDNDTAEVAKEWKKRLQDQKSVPPVEITKGPIHENIQEEDKVNLQAFPAPKWHENDGGQYVGTGCLVIMQDPDTGWINVAPYRVQVHGQKTATVYISPGKHGRIIMEKYWSAGRNCPVAVSLGQDPLLFMAGLSSVPFGISEYEYAGWMKGEPISITKGRFSKLPIPADAEVVIEGEIPPEQAESRVEGPIGEYTGYYAHGARKEPVIHVKCIMHRDDPIITGEPPMKPPAFNGAHSFVRAALLWDKVEKAGVPDVRGVAYHLGGMIAVISIRQRFPGHSRLAAYSLLGVRSGEDFRRAIIVVDDDIDPFSMEDVIWAFGTRCDPDHGIEIAHGRTSSSLDPLMTKEKLDSGDLTASTMIFDACIPYSRRKDFPVSNVMSSNLVQETIRKWGSLISESSLPTGK